MAQHGRFKAFSPLQQQFKLSLACQILSFFLNKVLICFETLQRSPAVVSVALGEHKVGSLLLSTAQRTKAGPLLFLSVGTIVHEERGRARHWEEDLKWPNTTCQHRPLSSDHTEPHYRKPALEKMRSCLDGQLYKPPVNSGPQQAPALADTSHKTLAFSYSCIKRQNTSYYPLSPMCIHLTMEMN